MKNCVLVPVIFFYLIGNFRSYLDIQLEPATSVKINYNVSDVLLKGPRALTKIYNV